MSASEYEPLRWPELLKLAEVWVRAQAKAGSPAIPPIMLLAQDSAFQELCNAAAAMGEPEHGDWCVHEVACKEDHDEIRSSGYGAAAMTVRDVLSSSKEPADRLADVADWVRRHTDGADGGSDHG